MSRVGGARISQREPVIDPKSGRVLKQKAKLGPVLSIQSAQQGKQVKNVVKNEVLKSSQKAPAATDYMFGGDSYRGDKSGEFGDLSVLNSQLEVAVVKKGVQFDDNRNEQLDVSYYLTPDDVYVEREEEEDDHDCFDDTFDGHSMHSPEKSKLRMPTYTLQDIFTPVKESKPQPTVQPHMVARPVASRQQCTPRYNTSKTESKLDIIDRTQQEELVQDGKSPDYMQEKEPLTLLNISKADMLNNTSFLDAAIETPPPPTFTIKNLMPENKNMLAKYQTQQSPIDQQIVSSLLEDSCIMSKTDDIPAVADVTDLSDGKEDVNMHTETEIKLGKRMTKNVFLSKGFFLYAVLLGVLFYVSSMVLPELEVLIPEVVEMEAKKSAFQFMEEEMVLSSIDTEQSVYILSIMEDATEQNNSNDNTIVQDILPVAQMAVEKGVEKMEEFPALYMEVELKSTNQDCMFLYSKQIILEDNDNNMSVQIETNAEEQGIEVLNESMNPDLNNVNIITEDVLHLPITQEEPIVSSPITQNTSEDNALEALLQELMLH